MIHPDVLPIPDPAWAFFLDVDGTLLDLAPSPTDVRVERDLPDLLRGLRAATEGAIALISGRSIHDVDALFPSIVLAVAGQHGLERRDARGVRSARTAGDAMLATARRRLDALAAVHPGLVVEDKGLSIAVHYRAAPALAALVTDTVRAMQEELGADYMLQPGKYVVELVLRGADKGEAIRAFMAESPFRGRLPVYLGDDLPDERGFAVVTELGGHAIKVGDGESTARWRLTNVREVKRWLTTAISLAAR